MKPVLKVTLSSKIQTKKVVFINQPAQAGFVRIAPGFSLRVLIKKSSIYKPARAGGLRPYSPTL